MKISINKKLKLSEKVNRMLFVGRLKAKSIPVEEDEAEVEGVTIKDEFYKIDEETDLDYLKSRI